MPTTRSSATSPSNSTTEWVAADGLHLAVRHRPCAPPAGQPARGVLLLHGWPGTRDDWRPVFDLLAAEPDWASVSLICPDLRGYGDSEAPPVDDDCDAPYAAYAPAAHLADMTALVAGYGLEEVVVGAYDLGANIAQAMARSLGARVRGLVLCDPVHSAARAQAGQMDLSQELWYQALHLQPWAADLVAHDRATVEVYLRHFYTHWWGSGRVQEDHFQALVDSYSRPGAFEASIGWYRSRAGTRRSEATAAAPITTPAEVLWGEEDPITPLVFSESLARSFEDARLTRLEGVGHFAPLEAHEAVADAFDAIARRLEW